MKTKYIFILLLIIPFFTISCSGENYMREISFTNLKEKLDNKESFVLLLKKEDCDYCKFFDPKIKEIATNYKITINYLMINNLTEDEYKDLNTIVNNFTGTPTTLFYKDGVELETWTRIKGNQSKELVISKFKALGYIKEEIK